MMTIFGHSIAMETAVLKTVGPWGCVVVLTLASIATAAAVYIVVEKPITRYLQRRIAAFMASRKSNAAPEALSVPAE